RRRPCAGRRMTASPHRARACRSRDERPRMLCAVGALDLPVEEGGTDTLGEHLDLGVTTRAHSPSSGDGDRAARNSHRSRPACRASGSVSGTRLTDPPDRRNQPQRARSCESRCARNRRTAMAVVTIRQLLDSGVHFGHQTRRWNPKVKRFILTERSGIHIIDLQQSLAYIDRAYEYVKETVAHGGTILFVGTKKQAQEAIAEQATRVGQPYVNQRWLGGLLTNFQTV